jgi:hypothetical protein
MLRIGITMDGELARVIILQRARIAGWDVMTGGYFS